MEVVLAGSPTVTIRDNNI